MKSKNFKIHLLILILASSLNADSSYCFFDGTIGNSDAIIIRHEDGAFPTPTGLVLLDEYIYNGFKQVQTELPSNYTLALEHADGSTMLCLFSESTLLSNFHIYSGATYGYGKMEAQSIDETGFSSNGSPKTQNKMSPIIGSSCDIDVGKKDKWSLKVDAGAINNKAIEQENWSALVALSMVYQFK